MRLIFRSCIIFNILIFMSCHEKITQSENGTDQKVPSGKFLMVKVKDGHGLDGCGFLLEREDGTKFEPVNLADSLKADGKKIRIKYVKEKTMGICMAGERIRLLEVIPEK
jgi:hypothetical protein